MDHRIGDREHRPVHDRAPDADLTSLDRLGPPIPADVLEARKRLPAKPDPVVLVGERVRVRPATLDDAVELFTISNGEPVTRLGRSIDAYDADELVWRFMPVGPFRSPEAYAEHLGSILDRPDWQTFVVEDAATGEALGSASLIANSPPDLKVEIGALWCTPAVQGLGVIQEACLLLIEHLLTLGYQRIEWKCHAGNARSRAAAVRLGFRFEGIQDHHMVMKGRRRDTAWFRILADERAQPDGG